MKYAFFIDIDGTLTWDRKIPEKNLSAISRARKEGHLVFLNTGRSLKFIPAFVIKDTELDGIVAGSGTYCSLGGEVLKADRIPVDKLKIAFDFLISNGIKFMFEGENVILCGNREIKAEGFYTIKSADQLDGEFSYAVIEKINISGVLTKDQLEFMSSMFYTLQHSDYAECSIFGCDKASGMKVITDRLGDDYRSVAIGDSINDVDMLKAADIAVAVASADESILGLCDIVTELDCGQGGVGEAIERIITENK